MQILDVTAVQQQQQAAYLKESKGLQDCPVPVIHLACHGLLDVSQSNAQQGEWLMRVQPVCMEELAQSRTLTCLQQHQTTSQPNVTSLTVGSFTRELFPTHT